MLLGDLLLAAAEARALAALAEVVDERTLEILEQRRSSATFRGRTWLMRRALAVSDLAALSAAYVVAALAVDGGLAALYRPSTLLVLAAAPAWVLAARGLRLYGHDEKRADHATSDEFMGVVQLVTLATFGYLFLAWAHVVPRTDAARPFVFWAAAVAFVTLGRTAARLVGRRSAAYVQTAVIVGAGTVGQLVARKILQHPEYGIHLVGFIDSEPREQRPDLRDLTILGSPDRLAEIVRELNVERVIVAFSNDRHEDTLKLIRSLRGVDVQIDIVPRLFEFVGPGALVHSIEGLPLIGMPPARLSPQARLAKRAIDIAAASFALIVAAPLMAFIAFRIRMDSEGPVFFRQTRLGDGMREFTSLKFRTMRVGTSHESHRDYIRSTMQAAVRPEGTGLFKLAREREVTRFGQWLRETSLDELPQLINVLRGDMSLVGPRPCIPYEIEHFEPHHFERFSVPAGITGLWQVTARAHSSFREALEMDVAYVRSYSLALDVRLLSRTPGQLLRRHSTA